MVTVCQLHRTNRRSTQASSARRSSFVGYFSGASTLNNRVHGSYEFLRFLYNVQQYQESFVDTLVDPSNFAARPTNFSTKDDQSLSTFLEVVGERSLIKENTATVQSALRYA
ncbi:uncharacterized protein LOC143155248 [Ptiloglossa arizonensis]|uniref:uncharacterized protein LOC143155248 n=1 Tax=Ptiloglossa arizonensis TaxID=3350558 RepID=UPI003FA0D5BD